MKGGSLNDNENKYIPDEWPAAAIIECNLFVPKSSKKLLQLKKLKLLDNYNIININLNNEK